MKYLLALLLALLALCGGGSPAHAQADPFEARIFPTHDPMAPSDLTRWRGMTDTAVFTLGASHGWVVAPAYDKTSGHYYYKRFSGLRVEFYKLTGTVNGVQQWQFLHRDLLGNPQAKFTKFRKYRGDPYTTWYWWRASWDVVVRKPSTSGKIKVVCSAWLETIYEAWIGGTIHVSEPNIRMEPRTLQFPATYAPPGPILPPGPLALAGGTITAGGTQAVQQQPETIEEPWGTMNAVRDDATGEIIAYVSYLSDPANPYVNDTEDYVFAQFAANPSTTPPIIDGYGSDPIPNPLNPETYVPSNVFFVEGQ